MRLFICFQMISIWAAFAPIAAAQSFCFEEAGAYYGISPALLNAISKIESNSDSHALNYNPASRSLDFGHMQINSYWRKLLGENYDLLGDACYCTMVGAWILRQCMNRYGYNWDAVACYHTGRGLSDANDSRKHENGRKYINKIKQVLSAMPGLE